MQSKRYLALSCLLILIVILPATVFASGEGSRGADKISPWVLDTLRSNDSTDFFVVLTTQADLTPAYRLPTKLERGRWVYHTLWETARRSQAPLRAWLDAHGVSYRPYYIVNLIYVHSGDLMLVRTLAARSDVARIEANPSIHNEMPRSLFPLGPVAPTSIEWNIQKVNAPDVWNMGYTGEGIVVGGQDTGYDWDHPALINQYRGWNGSTASHDYNWHDAVHSGGGSCGADSDEPCDDHGHGTHTMGTVLGDDGGSNQIGIAPGAKWIGCRNMNVGNGSPATYLECFEFFLAPYPVDGDPSQGNPDMAPDVTNNSWSCPSSEGCSWDTLQAAVEAQRAAGIMTVVSAGNEGSGCSTVQDPPAIYDAAYSVGATNSSDNIASFSSRGPVTADGSSRRKPDISAPGVGIRSSVPGGGYQGGWSGTSMAGPHVAGAVALLWSAAPELSNDITTTEEILNASAVPRYSTQCGDPPNAVPNNVYGWGRLDVLAAVQRALALSDDQGHLNGIVMEAGSAAVPIPGAVVQAITATLPYTTTTDAVGAYTLTLSPEVYTVSAWKYGYHLRIVSNVIVTREETTTLPITLTSSAPYALTGCVRDAPTGKLLTATITVIGPLNVPVTTTTATGCYTLTLYGSPYAITTEAEQHTPATVSLDLITNTVQDFILEPLNGHLWGYVTDLKSGDPIPGARVRAQPGLTTAIAGMDGRYSLSLSPGAYTITAYAYLYGTVVEQGVVISAAEQIRRDYALPAAHLSFFPSSLLSITLDYDSRVTTSVVLSNVGSLPLTFQVDDPAEEWLTAAPVSGTVPPGAAIPISVTFDATALGDYGSYTSHLRWRTNDPHAQPYGTMRCK